MTRVGYVLKVFPRLSETFILSEILGLEAAGASVTIFSLRPASDPQFHPELGLLKSKVIYLSPLGMGDCLATVARIGAEDLGGVLERWTRLARDPALAAPERTLNQLGEEAGLGARLAAHARELGITHLHAHFGTIASRVAHLASAVTKGTYSFTCHAKDIYRETVNWRLFDFLASQAAACVTVCDANVEHLRARLSPAAFDKVRRIYNGIDLERFTPPSKTTSPQEGSRGRNAPLRVLSVGRLVPKKGFDHLLSAADALRKRGTFLSVRIIGDGPEKPALERQLLDLDLRETVELLGPRSSHEVRAALEQSDLFVLPCMQDEDGNRDALPTVLIEAMAMRVPCVSTDIGGVPEILGPDEAGLVVPAEDDGALVRAVALLADDASLRNRLADAGRRRAERLFDRKRQAQELIEAWGGRA